MIRRSVLVAITAMSLVVSFGGRASAEVYGRIPVQGYLTDPSGTPIDGIQQMTFGVYATEISGTALYSEMQNVTVDQGHFAAYVGDIAAEGGLPLSIFRAHDSAWVHVAVGGDSSLPRWEVGVTPYAAVADYAREANAAATCNWSGNFAAPLQAALPNASIASDMPVAVGSATLDTPVSGNVLAMYTGEINAGAGESFAEMAICDSADTFDLGLCHGATRSVSLMGGSGRSLSFTQVFPVTAGTHTFYLNAATDLYFANNPSLIMSRLSFVFIPQ